jgi:hypothetical protein
MVDPMNPIPSFLELFTGSSSSPWTVANGIIVIVMVTVVTATLTTILWHIACSFIPALHRLSSEKSPPVIGYKKATLLRSPSPGKHFAGVIGFEYSVDDDANGLGFHAYRSFAQAAAHPQNGNVMLEVLLSGVVREHREGYIASHQRVLQVIADRCTFCKSEAKYFVPRETEVEFNCEKHVFTWNTNSELVRQGLKIALGRGKSPYGVRPVRLLVEEFPWLDEHKIVVAERFGPNEFVPTVIS